MKTIPLTQGKDTIVDDDDFEYFNQWKWRAEKKKGRIENWYAVRHVGRKQIYLHRILLKVPNKMVTDHINGNGLDNRKINLRICTQQQNIMNRRKTIGVSKFKGVSLSHNKWQAGIKKNKRFFYLGLFIDEKDAAMAYDNKARELFGEFANLNFPSKIYALS